MAVYIITGKLGSGKTIAAVGRMQDYLFAGRRVVTNIDINLAELIGRNKKIATMYRLPDVPTASDLEAIGQGSDSSAEETFGGIFIDEAARFLNTRNFQDKDRAKFIDWLVHARKLRWDVYIIIQHVNALDKQIRDMFAEHIVTCMRLDRLTIPVIGHITGFFGLPLRLPKMHYAAVRYGSGQASFVVERWMYTGRSLYPAFNTEQKFNLTESAGLYQVLPPWYTHGRYPRVRDYIGVIRKLSTAKASRFFWAGLIAGVAAVAVAAPAVFSGGQQSGEPQIVSAPVSNPAADHVDQVNPLPGVRIAGSMYYGDGKGHYFFELDGAEVDLEAEGWQVRWGDRCRAVVRRSRNDPPHFVRCKSLAGGSGNDMRSVAAPATHASGSAPLSDAVSSLAQPSPLPHTPTQPQRAAQAAPQGDPQSGEAGEPVGETRPQGALDT